MNDQDTSKISRYLLGELPPEEMDALEARLLSESKLFDLAESVEDDVIDRYVRGELSREEARRFERRLLPSVRVQERVAFARALAFRKAAGRRSRRPAALAPVVPLFRSPLRLAWAATLVAVLLAGALGFEVLQLKSQQDQLRQSHTAALAQLDEARQSKTVVPPAVEPREKDDAVGRLARELSEARERIAELETHEEASTERRVRRPRKLGNEAAVAAVFLGLATRTGAEAETVNLTDLGEERDLELQLDLGGLRPARPLATVYRGGQPVYQDEAEVEAMDGESMARLVLPRQSLLEGRYRIELAEGETGISGDLLGTYELSVTR